MTILIAITFLVAFLSSVLSGLSGGGGGFIMTPYFLLIGLSPQQNVAAGSVIGLGLTGSSLLAMRGQKLVKSRFLWPLIGLTVLVTIAAMFFLPKLNGQFAGKIVGALLLLLLPTLFINKKAFLPGERSGIAVKAGYGLYGLLLFGNALIGAGLAALLFVPLMFLLGLTPLQANATKRVVGLVQSALMFIVLLPQGFIVWGHAIAGLAGAWLGGYIGTHIAIRGGDRFVKIGLAIFMALSGVTLIIFN